MSFSISKAPWRESLSKGWKVNDHLAEVGRKMLIADLDLHLVGLRPQEEKDVTLTLPENYARKELAGKQIQVHLKVKEIKEKILPALDDDFAKDVGDHATLADLESEAAPEPGRAEKSSWRTRRPKTSS